MNEKTKLLTKDVKPRKGEMIKPTELIAVKGIEGWNLSDRRLWDLLLANAWSGERLEDPRADFEIPIAELRGKHDSNDRIRESLEKLQKTLVRVKMPDGRWRSVQMLGRTDMTDDERTTGLLTYDYPKSLVPLLRKSELYTRLEIKVLSSFTSKYSRALYEVIASRVRHKHKTAEEIDTETLRQWLGVEGGKLETWSDLRRYAVEPAQREVNQLAPEFGVCIEPIKRGRAVVRFAVSWAKKEARSIEEQAAVLEVNRSKVGRSARITGTAERIVNDLPVLSEADIQKGWAAGERKHGVRLDKQAAYAEWRAMVKDMQTTPTNLTGHFIAFCEVRAKNAK